MPRCPRDGEGQTAATFILPIPPLPTSGCRQPRRRRPHPRRRHGIGPSLCTPPRARPFTPKWKFEPSALLRPNCHARADASASADASAIRRGARRPVSICVHPSPPTHGCTPAAEPPERLFVVCPRDHTNSKYGAFKNIQQEEQQKLQQQQHH